MADRTESSIRIAATPAEVLDVIADFEQYPEWAKEMRSVEVLVREGDGWADQVRFVLDAGVLKDTYTLDYEWAIADDGSGVVSWGLVSADLLKALTGSYTLTAADDGAATDVTYRLEVDLKIPMLGMLKRKAERSIVETALTSLKRRVEAGG